jgi:hypothetical protein
MNVAMFEKGSPSVISQIKLLIDGQANASIGRQLLKYPNGK